MEKSLKTTTEQGVTLSFGRHSSNDMVPAKIDKTFAAVKTVRDSVALSPQDVPCLLRLAHTSEESARSVTALLAANIYALDRFLHLKNGMSNEEVFFAAESVLNEFGGGLTFADVKIVLEGAKMGKYGMFYERLSAPQVIEWFRTYFDERMQAAENYNLSNDRRQYGVPTYRPKPQRETAAADDDTVYREYMQRKINEMTSNQKLAEQ